jgi:hypothetical protein
MHHWNALLSLDLIKNHLQEEKSQIFKIIWSHIDKYKHEFESRTGQSFDPIPGKDTIKKIKNFSPFLCAILFGRQIQDKIRRMMAFAE